MTSVRLADRYVLLAPLRSGGEARVFRARDDQSGNDVAVRLALAGARAAVGAPPALSHDGWVRFIDSGIDPQHGAYQVFELLEGRTLGEVARHGRLSRHDWRAFVDQSLAAVEAIHRAGRVHGDLNADNFFRTPFGWKLLDLPFFRFEVPAGRSSMFGSVYTLAPEQIDGAAASARSDLYSLGCLYYYAACGQWPHPGDTMREIALERLLRAAPKLRDHASDLSAAWSDWVMTLLERAPGDRPPSLAAARQLLADAVA
jgi:serine/threonine protein kinase